MYLVLLILFLWFSLYLIGRQFALRDKLQKSDAIVCLAGTRGNINTLHERIDTALKLYDKGFATTIIMSSKFSKRVNKKFKQLKFSEIKKYAAEGRIANNHVNFAYNNWDLNLGADYMKQYAVKRGIPKEHVIVEDQSLNTRENAEFTLPILKEHNFKSIILVTSPFHQRRAYLMFSKVLKPRGVTILNYAAESKRWNKFFWFLSYKNVSLVFRELIRIIQYRKPA